MTVRFIYLKKTIGIYRYQSLMIVIDIMNFITGHYYY